MKEYKCKDCIHYCVCKDTVTEDNWTDETPMEIKAIFSPKYCDYFYPAADVESVRHGEWIEIKKYSEMFGVDFILGYRCSLCGRREEYLQPYCNCGAKMNGGNE